MMTNHARRLYLPLLLCLLLSGCGGPNFPTGPVSGRITLDGQPLVKAHVSFQPIATGNSNPGPGSFGVTDADGRFQLHAIASPKDGAVVGQHVVRITPYRTDEATDSDEVRPRDNSLPPQADDGSLRFDVPAGGSDAANFALTSSRRAQ